MLHTFSKFIIAFSLIAILTYLGFSFMFLSFSPSDWGLIGRSTYVGLMLLLSIVASTLATS